MPSPVQSTCKHCKSVFIEEVQCPDCNVFLGVPRQCMPCHRELAHQIIEIQNASFFGGKKLDGHSSFEKDPDCYRIAEPDSDQSPANDL